MDVTGRQLKRSMNETDLWSEVMLLTLGLVISGEVNKNRTETIIHV